VGKSCVWPEFFRGFGNLRNSTCPPTKSSTFLLRSLVRWKIYAFCYYKTTISENSVLTSFETWRGYTRLVAMLSSLFKRLKTNRKIIPLSILVEAKIIGTHRRERLEWRIFSRMPNLWYKHVRESWCGLGFRHEVINVVIKTNNPKQLKSSFTHTGKNIIPHGIEWNGIFLCSLHSFFHIKMIVSLLSDFCVCFLSQ